MARDSTEVLVGTGTLYIAPVGTAYPANPATSPSGSWVDPGYSEGGWAFVVDQTFEDVEVAEEVDPVRVLKTAQAISFRGELAQASLENFQIAFGGGTIADDTPSAGFRTYSPPASSAFTERALLFRTEAPPGDGTEFRDFKLYRTVATGAVEVSHAKAPQKQLVSVEFRLLIPTSGNIYDIVDDKP